MFDLAGVRAAAALIAPLVPPTPQYAWPLLARRAGRPVWVKHDNHTPTGAIKVRGGLVYPRISRMSADFLVQEGRIWHKYQRVFVKPGARRWNTQRVNPMMGLCGSISTGD
jgi:hypothetical protein